MKHFGIKVSHEEKKLNSALGGCPRIGTAVVFLFSDSLLGSYGKSQGSCPTNCRIASFT